MRDRQESGAQTPLIRAGLHPMSCAGGISLAAFILFVGTLIIRHNDLPAATDLRIAGGSLLLGLAALAGPLLRYVRSEVVVTPARLRLRLGGWRPRVTDLALRDVEEVEVRSGRLGRQMDFGTFAVASRNDDGVVVHHLRRAAAIEAAINRANRR
jgi:hypothetical protein